MGQSGLLDLFVYASRNLLPLAFSTLGALIITRQPSNRIGLLLPALSTFFDVFSELFVGRMTAPPAESSTLLLIAVWANRISWVLSVFPLFLTLLLSPPASCRRRVGADWCSPSSR
jgi:hypothetical protein